MNRISGVDTQGLANQITGQIADLSASGRVHKKPLAQVLKDVQSAARKLVEFPPEQAGKIAEGMEKAVSVLAAQKSGMEEKKAGNLRALASHLRACFSQSMDKMDKSIASCRQKQADLSVMVEREEVRIGSRHQGKIEALRDYLGDIRESSFKRDALMQERNRVDTAFNALLSKSGFSESEKRIAQQHYEAPTTREVKGFDHHSSDDVFSDKEAQRLFGGRIIKHMEYGRRTYVEIPTKVYQAANARGKAWVRFRQLAEERRKLSGELYRQPARSESMRERAVRVEIKAEKAAWNTELETLQKIFREESVQLHAEIAWAGDQRSSLQEAHDALLKEGNSTLL